ncbi:MAG: 16S rRNA (cytosine(1402)-N(4))-methyltransferase [Candidatus Doudnabacteria bacterium RIFCSPLOWO2_02_FULL_49_13]|uniref:Ribosomal RNA small subunit methyltransferase H n=1 Tax=Candidatus Doudnabacteria bacterium RIFCSPHIGHO2_12_FULL_48_16 TaxID=1817838 RepID=A0A1F5PL62_9BACT|nr:MAG: 16S rRNA (cytosine(1402)-N(4))-methyltransferase [Candidatus Doudnabacteria bacterium RIFCSPHIGHO2_02_FULL_49_24]OGE88829.1 MAG: 16S rRNA (cytosine(1402)-N(4))-methyltransferase [Candidatus Doudnabacteria bacterium RIFCSPHIGHO2_01_FULL_50_67]OGE90651.1 MAG: 16S rRNA (cytosine(1402)-N(4))-methyltransferase [Candidatus Doudnabacteria bacterium RIFCSPHIGHO2_12_FULL_48_16]OGE96982.1 MAG: 16S rRNA (cytosine(1402)-N(4))-methyltransferase [Candidatus Doudnabacteria bacterium RIFCSPLOWO2_01_FULL
MHVPVLLKETLEYLNAASGGRFADGTVGSGGHTIAILNSNPVNQVLGIDLDQTSLDKLRERLVQESLNQRATLVKGNYVDLDSICAEHSITELDGILLDLGFSSDQVDQAKRGFSFQSEGPLDMRFDSSSKVTAEQVVNHYHVHELAEIFKDFGEEKFAGRIAREIVAHRQKGSILSTGQLAEIIKQALPKPIQFKAADSQRRIFQALRIEVNRELVNLKTVLPKCLKLLKPAGRLVVISFQSLEDRIVKEFFNEQARECVCPPEFPTCVCDKISTLRILTRKPATASEEEIKTNSRSKPAKLRAAQKI